jgi:hypothetical protein
MKPLEDKLRASGEQRAGNAFGGCVGNFLRRVDLMLIACWRGIAEGFAACGRAEFHGPIETYQRRFDEGTGKVENAEEL